MVTFSPADTFENLDIRLETFGPLLAAFPKPCRIFLNASVPDPIPFNSLFN